MPFELGLAVSWTILNPSEHNWYVLETRPRRILKSLSDLNGFEPFIRGYGVDGTLRALTDIFLRPTEQRSAKDLKRLYRTLLQQVPTIKKRSGSKTLFAPRAIRELVLAGLRRSPQPSKTRNIADHVARYSIEEYVRWDGREALAAGYHPCGDCRPAAVA